MTEHRRIVTAVTPQQRDKSRMNIHIDGVYSFSLDLSQVLDFGVRKGVEYTDEDIVRIKSESDFGKLYVRSLEYALMRPRSVGEIKQYLYRKSRPTRTKDGLMRDGYPVAITERVLDRLVEKKYVDDEKFASYWVENRRLGKGASMRSLRAELSAKGVSSAIVDAALLASERSDTDELRKVIEKKSSRYSDKQKFIQYLVRQGFSYGDVVDELSGWGT